MELDYVYLSECFDADFDNGTLHWKAERPSHHFKNVNGNKIWHRRFAGRAAGHFDKYSGYARVGLKGKLVLVHRILWVLKHGSINDGILDHIDGDTTNNRINNLRLCGHCTNQKNAKKRVDNTSGITGISWQKNKRLWIVHANDKGKNVVYKRFKSRDDAEEFNELIRSELGYAERHGK